MYFSLTFFYFGLIAFIIISNTTTPKRTPNIKVKYGDISEMNVPILCVVDAVNVDGNVIIFL